MNSIIDVKKTELIVTEPVTLAEAKAQCIVTYTDDDTLITRLITAARRAVENFTLTSIVSKRVILTAIIQDEWELPWGPVVDVEAVQTPQGTTGSGPVQYLSASSWNISGEEFKTFGAQPWGSNLFIVDRYPDECGQRYRITYTVGYDRCPQDLKEAILQEIAYRYEHRGEENQELASEKIGVCQAAQELAMPYKRMSWQ